MVTFDVSARVRELPANFWGAMDLQIAALAKAAGPRVIDVSKGNPDLPTPEHIVTAMQRAVAEPLNHRYPSYAGRKRLRDAVALRYREDHGVVVDPDSEVAIFHGAHEAIIAAVGALADPHTTVVVPDPGYPIYRSAATLVNADAVTLPLREPHFQPDFDSLRALEAARILFLNYPNNPTGALASRAAFGGALAFCRRTGAAFVHDFVYSSLGFDGQKPLSALTVDTKLDVTVELQTLSKTYSMAGWRVGFAVGNASIISAMKRYQAHAFSTMFGATQDAAAAALEGDQSGVAHLVGVYERRRNLVIAGIRRLGWDVAAPAGTFFVWVRLPGAQDAVQFAQRLRDEQRVAVAPGDGFGESGRGYIRIGLVDDEATLTELIERLAAFTRRK